MYAKAGRLRLFSANSITEDLAQWSPIHGPAPPDYLMPLLQFSTETEGSSQTYAAAWRDLSGLRNKTILLIGDSVDRRTVRSICKGLEKSGQTSYFQGTLYGEQPSLSTWSDDEFNQPHICTLKASGLRIM